MKNASVHTLLVFIETYMLFISHRGNVEGSLPEKENTISYIDDAVDLLNLDVMVDVIGIGGYLYLGTHTPKEKLPLEYLDSPKFWFHCNNPEALEYFKVFSKVKYFWHDEDAYSLISNKKVLVHSGEILLPGSIALLPESNEHGHSLWNCHAVCTNYVFEYQKLYKEWNALQNLLI